jgi:hypothetical protein
VQRTAVGLARSSLSVLLDEALEHLLNLVRSADVVERLCAVLASRLNRDRSGADDAVPQRLRRRDVVDVL